jgi:hypothetical protein
MILPTTLTLQLTARQCEMIDSLIGVSLAAMAHALQSAKDPKEAEFYRLQPLKFLALQTVIGVGARKAHLTGSAAPIKVTADQLLMIAGSLGKRNLEDVRALSEMPVGKARQARSKAAEEWRALSVLVAKHDPRKKDFSQDAAPGDYPEEE